MSVNPIDLRIIDKRVANVYEGIIVAGKKARAINDDRKIEFNAQLESVPVTSISADDDSEDFDNPAQLNLSLKFEKREKPHVEALNELLDGKIEFDLRNKTV